jgi:GTP-binding protein HflX
MFATLDPTSRRLRLPREQEVIINDTVGFIRDLPPDLLSAFRATLEEIDNSNLLIHLVDASSPRWQQQIDSVARILSELHLAQIPTLLALNKADLVDKDTMKSILKQAGRDGSQDALAISATQTSTLRSLLDKTGEMLARNLTSGFGEKDRYRAERSTRIA